jgi:hypothetical protein
LRAVKDTRNERRRTRFFCRIGLKARTLYSIRPLT